jgi:hypothetical protein
MVPSWRPASIPAPLSLSSAPASCSVSGSTIS